MSWQKGLDAPQDTQQFACLQSTSSRYPNLTFHGWDTQLATHRQKVAGDPCKTPSPARKKQSDRSLVVKLFKRDPSRATHPVDNLHEGKPWGRHWKQRRDEVTMGEHGLVPHRVPPQAVGFQTSVNCLILPSSLDGKKDIIQNDWRMAESSPVTASLPAKSLKVSLALTFGVVRLTDLQGTAWALRLSNTFLKARLRALGSLLTYAFKHNFSPILILSEQPYPPASSRTCHQAHTF